MPDQLACRRAIEALRNGVPNREAVRILGSTQPQAEQQFQARLALGEGKNPEGLLISGDFGTGKSHLLEHFEDLALDRNFVCSRIAVSKETPFYDLGKMFRAAADSGALPDGRVGAMVDEIGNRLPGPKDAGYARFFQWADSTGSGLHRIVVRQIGLDDRVPRLRTTSGASRYLRQQLEGAFRRAEIRHVDADVRQHHAREFH